MKPQLLPLLSTLSLFSLTLAHLTADLIPVPELDSRADRTRCLNPSDTKTLKSAYVRLMAEFDPKDGLYLSNDFVEYSDSVNALDNRPLGQPAFPTKEAFLDAQKNNPPLPLSIDEVRATTCDTIVVTWTAKFGAGLPVRGVTAIQAVWEKEESRQKARGEMWKIGQLDVEFNGLAYVVNAGESYTFGEETFGAKSLGRLKGQ